jgi:predicted small metal-binding protein
MTPFHLAKADEREELMNKVLKIMISHVNDIIDDKGINQIKKCIRDIY